MTYQTFDVEHPGDSDSYAKLEALRLNPARFKGVDVLDLGCNEGFFSGKAREYGARLVRGVDIDGGLIQKASERFPDVDFENRSWDDELPDDCGKKWDIVMMLSASHYVEDQPVFFGHVAESLSDDGIFVLECGISQICQDGWQRVTRADGSMVKYPSLGVLQGMLRDAGLTSRVAGPSVSQRGDPIGRYVVHCYVRHPSIMVVSGLSRAGKTLLCESLNIPYFSVDDFVAKTAMLEDAAWGKLLTSRNLSGFYEALASDPAALAGFLESLFDSIPKQDTVVIDAVDTVSAEILRHGTSLGYRAWAATKW